MTTRLSLILFCIILALIVLDTAILDSGITLETLRKGHALVQSMAFWR